MEKQNDYSSLDSEIKEIYASNSTEEACRQLLSIYDSSQLDTDLGKEDTRTAQLFDLAVKYLDKDFADQKPEIEQQIKNLLV